MEIKGTGKLLRIYIGADDRFKHQPLFEAIVHKLREAGLAGATVLRGVEGYGSMMTLEKVEIIRYKPTAE